MRGRGKGSPLPPKKEETLRLFFCGGICPSPWAGEKKRIAMGARRGEEADNSGQQKKRNFFFTKEGSPKIKKKGLCLPVFTSGGNLEKKRFGSLAAIKGEKSTKKRGRSCAATIALKGRIRRGRGAGGALESGGREKRTAA